MKDKEKVRVMYVTNNKIMESLALYTQQKLQEVGLEVELNALDASAASDKSLDKENKEFDITFGGYIMGPEPDSYKSLFLSNAEYNYARYKTLISISYGKKLQLKQIKQNAQNYIIKFKKQLEKIYLIYQLRIRKQLLQ